MTDANQQPNRSITVTHQRPPEGDANNDRRTDSLYTFATTLVGFSGFSDDLIKFTGWTGGSAIAMVALRVLLFSVVPLNLTAGLVGTFTLLVFLLLILMQMREAFLYYPHLRFRIRLFCFFCVSLGFVLGASDAILKVLHVTL